MTGKEKLPIAIFNGVVATCNGLYRVSDISIDDARNLLQNNEIISAVGHADTAEIMSEIFGIDIPFNRIQFVQQVGQKAVIFKLNVRPVEGVILSKQEILEIGFTFKLMEKLE